MIKLVAKWNGSEYPMEVPEDSTVGAVRQLLADLTEVQPKRQKLIGLGKKPNPEDELSLSALQLKSGGHAFMMVGCKEASVVQDIPASELPEVINDLDWDYQPEEYKNVQISPEYRANVEQKLSKISIQVMNPPRKGKKLLVLDLDYTLLDSADIRNATERISDLKRPYCDHLLEKGLAYVCGVNGLSAARRTSNLLQLWPHYDIVVWSQTSWRWLEVKLTEMGILQNPDLPPPRWQISFVLDKRSMFSVTSLLPDKRKREHEVKPLEFIWRRFPEFYDRRNTVHIDDLSRNFVLNPANGLKCTAFKEALRVRGDDKELYYLTAYLEHIALNVTDFTALKHGQWADYLQRNQLT